MKHSESKVLLVVAAVACLFFIAGTAQAQTCTLDNWSAKVGDTNLSAGTQGANNRRYAGPCGLRVGLAGSEAYLTDNSPVAETVFNTRFYFFLNSVTQDVSIFEALDGTDRAISATYDHSESKVNVVFQTGNGSTSSTLSVGPVATGWNSLEIQWSSGATATPKAILGNASATDTKTSVAVDTSNFTIDSAKLGAINALATVPSGGSIDFDDYDSRRDTVPGRVCRGLTDPNRAVGNSGFQELKFEDLDNIFSEIASRGSSPAAGAPDFDQDGSVRFADLDAVFQRIAARQVSCEINR